MRSASVVIASSPVLLLAVSTLPPGCKLQAARARVKKRAVAGQADHSSSQSRELAIRPICIIEINSSDKLRAFACAIALAKAGFAPAIKDSIYEVISNCFLLGNHLMTFFAFPHRMLFIICLFEYHSHIPFYYGLARPNLPSIKLAASIERPVRRLIHKRHSAVTVPL